MQLKFFRYIIRVLGKAEARILEIYLHLKSLRKRAHAIIHNFFGYKIEIFQLKIFVIFFFAQNIDCGYKLEPPRQGGSNEYPQSMFWSKNKKNRFAI